MIEYQTCWAISGIIWDKRIDNFVSIFSIREYMVFQNKIRNEIELHNFQGQEIRNIFQFYDNDKKVTGICGDIWTTVSRYLNFTIVFTKTDIRTLGVQTYPHNNTYSGLLGIIQNNENMIIPLMEAFIPRLEVVQFTVPLWKTRHRMFIKTYSKYKITWMLDLFSWHIWCLILIFYIVLSFISILSHRMINTEYKQLISSVSDHLFYNFGALCNQGDALYLSQKKLKIQSFCISMFSWLIITCFTSQLIVYVTETVLEPPFENLETLFKHTDYTILSEKHSIVYISFEQNYRPIYSRIKKMNRIKFYTSHRYMWDLACSNKNNYAILQHESIKMDDNLICELKPVGVAYIKTWMVAGLPKKFMFKKSIDISIMKLHEFGVINVLKSRWLKSVDTDINVDRYYSPIELDQLKN
ncbi:uncharacterized protein LOC106646723 [Copidosoma floridanum]|uniref:uncharacterized protein LOC106646723 n=1 Tax=Copidosoma floridanum TaxID=29053 RepID=UPI0006C972CA|nr:uncharacterized protein LOC106646723 [Copidosoma floridanum]